MTEENFIKEIASLVGKYPSDFLNSIAIAQACLESFFGRSDLAANANNYFGIKSGGDWKGDVYYKNTQEDDGRGKLSTIKAGFRKYKSMEESVKDHARFLTSTPWRSEYYKDVINAKTPELQAQALTGTYATDTRYKAKLMDIINTYNLKQYDKANNQEVKTMAYVGIDIGHGSNTFPSQGKGVFKNNIGYSEHGFNSKVAIKLKEKLEASGIKVTYGLQQPNSPDVGLTRRTNWFNANKVDVVVSIHANASSNPAVNGRCAFYWHTSSKGKRLAQNIINEIKKKGYTTHGNGLHAGVRGSWTNLHINRETNMPAVLIEHGFMTGNKDFDLIFGKQRDKYVEDMADADARAICNYFGVSYRSSAKTEPNTPWERKSGQTGIFVAGHNIIRRDKPTVTANRTGIISAGDVIKYNGLFHADGYSWLEFKDGKGKYQYLPYRQHKPEEEWGKVMSQAEYDKNYASKPKVKKDKDAEPKGLFKVQTGAFIKKENAEALAKKMEKDGYDTHIVKDE